MQFNNAPGNTLGGTAIGAGNVISGNDATGVLLFGGATTANVLQGNLIGTKGDGLTPLGNTSHGVLVSAAAANNFIGSGGIGNTIAHNQAHGVAVAFPSRSVIRTNSIFDNVGLGIDLHINGVTPNDLAESDTAQNFPVITSVTANRVEGTLSGRPHATFVVELFASDEADPSGHGEGREFIGADTITTDAGGNANFVVDIGPLAEGKQIAATATDIVGNATSEFSESVNSSSETNEDSRHLFCRSARIDLGHGP